MKKSIRLFGLALFFFVMVMAYPRKVYAKTYTYKRTYCVGQVISPRVAKLITAKNASKAKWTSSDTSVAKVSKKGRITIRKRGKVTITATYSENTVVFKITAGKYWIPVTNKFSGNGNFKFVVTKVSPKRFVIKVTNNNTANRYIKFEYFKIGTKVYYTDMDRVIVAPNASRTIILKHGTHFKKKIDLNNQAGIKFHYKYYS